MTPQEALNVLNNAVAQINATRKDHQILAAAIETLDQVVKETEAAKIPRKAMKDGD